MNSSRRAHATTIKRMRTHPKLCRTEMLATGAEGRFDSDCRPTDDIMAMRQAANGSVSRNRLWFCSHSAPTMDEDGKYPEMDDWGRALINVPNGVKAKAVVAAKVVSVLSYNVLAQVYAKPDIFNYCRPVVLKWRYRRESLMREICFVTETVGICLFSRRLLPHRLIRGAVK